MQDGFKAVMTSRRGVGIPPPAGLPQKETALRWAHPMPRMSLISPRMAKSRQLVSVTGGHCVASASFGTTSASALMGRNGYYGRAPAWLLSTTERQSPPGAVQSRSVPGYGFKLPALNHATELSCKDSSPVTSSASLAAQWTELPLPQQGSARIIGRQVAHSA
jgi:hypothetical protein